jgi:tRNA dimethylallyltransferase
LLDGAPLLAVVGPTGSGKTALAIALAETLGGELVGCDALQIYRRFDIATAKPNAAERARVPHHLVDAVDPEDDFTLARFVGLAERVLESVCRRGAQPILVGGTGMYLRGLLRGIVPAPKIDPALRRRLGEMHERRGDKAMHRWLRRVDPDSASRVEPRDRQRVGRALEWWLASRTRWSERLESQGTWNAGAERYRCLKLGLEAAPEWLGPRLAQRVEGFFAAGLVDEVRSLLETGVSPECNAFQAIGYREVAHALHAGLSMEDVIARVTIQTRQYAKRQRTWFRKEPGIVWLDASASPSSLLADGLAAWVRFKQQASI